MCFFKKFSFKKRNYFRLVEKKFNLDEKNYNKNLKKKQFSKRKKIKVTLIFFPKKKNLREVLLYFIYKELEKSSFSFFVNFMHKNILGKK